MENGILSIVYSKLTGELYYCTSHSSPQSLAMFGKFEEEFSQVFDVVNIQYNEYLYNNQSQFYFDLKTKELKMKPITNSLNEIKYL